MARIRRPLTPKGVAGHVQWVKLSSESRCPVGYADDGREYRAEGEEELRGVSAGGRYLAAFLIPEALVGNASWLISRFYFQDRFASLRAPERPRGEVRGSDCP